MRVVIDTGILIPAGRHPAPPGQAADLAPWHGLNRQQGTLRQTASQGAWIKWVGGTLKPY